MPPPRWHYSVSTKRMAQVVLNDS